MFDQGNGAPLIVIPGIQGRWEWMKPALGELKNRCHVVSYTLCGDAGSGMKFDRTLGFNNFMRQLDRIYETAARGMKRVAMELGGKSPNIVFEDADLDAAAIGVVSGIFGAAGQMCIAGSRLLVQNSIKKSFTDRLVTLARDVRLGDPMQPTTNVGPIATPPQFAKVLEYIEIARGDGARCILGGKPATGPGVTGGQFVEPTIFTDVTNDMRIAQEEVFGPVLSIIGFDDEQDAIELGNSVIYGLVAGVWTGNIGRAMRMTRALRAGTVWVNTYRAYSFMMPFGGVKMSGLGRENGIEAVHEFLETKSVFLSTSATPPANPFLQR